jgi:hypothetical protein
MYGKYKRSLEARLMPPNLRVRFMTTDTKWLPTPSPVALRIHACVAKILNKSGIAEQINEILCEDDRFDDITLNTDGSVDSAALNNFILLRFYRKLNRFRHFPVNPIT